MGRQEIIRAKIKSLTEEEAKAALRTIVGLAEDGEAGRVFTAAGLNYILDVSKYSKLD